MQLQKGCVYIRIYRDAKEQRAKKQQRKEVEEEEEVVVVVVVVVSKLVGTIDEASKDVTGGRRGGHGARARAGGQVRLSVWLSVWLSGCVWSEQHFLLPLYYLLTLLTYTYLHLLTHTDTD